MTASARRRDRVTKVGAVIGIVGVVALIATSFVAVSTLRSSQEGRAPDIEVRQVVTFPDTPNAAIGIVDDFDRLTSLAVLTLDPSGVGGSVVVVPVNVDQTNGFGPERLPISRQPFTPGDEAQTAQLVSQLEPLLTLTIEHARVVGPEELATLLEPFGVVRVELPERVIDSDTPGSGFVAAAGSGDLDTDTLVRAFTAISVDGTSYSHHDVDVALWEGLAAQAPLESAPVVPTDEFERPVAPSDFDELLERLVAGEVGVRALGVSAIATEAAENEDGSDFVVADRLDALLVFGSISPGLVSSPNEAPTLQLVVGFDEAEVEALGETADGVPISKASMTRRFIGELLFKQANIRAVDLAATPGAVPERTQIFISSDALEAPVRALSDRFFADAEVIVSDRVVDGVDAVVVLGRNFLVQRAELLEIEREQAADAVTAGESSADFDVSPDSPVDTGVTAPTVSTSELDGTVTSESGVPSDTVGIDG